MKTNTKILAILSFILISIAGLQPRALAQIPLPTNCIPAPGTINTNVIDRAIHFKMNGNQMPRPGLAKDQMTGFIKADNRVDATFNLPHNRPDGPGRYSLVSYKFNPGPDNIAGTGDDIYTLYDYESVVFPLGNSNNLKVRIPDCLYRVFFVMGCVQDFLVPTATGQVYGGFEGIDPGGQIIRIGLPSGSELDPTSPDFLSVCPDCPGLTNIAETDHFYFRFIEQIDNGDGTTRLFFSVINKGIQPGDGPLYTDINPFLTGDVSFEGNEASIPASVLQVTLPQHNVPYEDYRYNFQIRNVQGQPAGSQNRFVTFDHRNHHNNHTYDSFQSDVFVLTVPTASLAGLTQVRICAEITDKHPEPGKTLPPIECGIVDIGCEVVEEPCVFVETSQFYASIDTVLQDGTDAIVDIRVINKTAQQVDFVQFADRDAGFGDLDVNTFGATPIVYETPFSTVNNTYNVTSLTYPLGSTPTISYDPSGERATLNFDLASGSYGLNEEETFTIRMSSKSFVLNAGIIKIYFQTVGGTLDSALFAMGECGEIVPLPVELTRFDAKYIPNNQDVLVSWQTAMEKDNKGFAVERSADGKAFTAVGEIAGGADGNQLRDYKFVDEQPLQGLSFYRLKQIDLDGSVSYSKIAMVNSGKAVSDFEINLAPNPCANGDCEIRIANAKATETTIELIDMTGRLIFRQVVDGQQETIRIPANKVKGLKGVFLLHAKSGDAVAAQRIILE